MKPKEKRNKFNDSLAATTQPSSPCIVRWCVMELLTYLLDDVALV